jgi:hypothetical protein
MVASVGIASDALVADLDIGAGALARIHAELARALIGYGELVHADRSDRDRLIESVRILMERAPDAGKAWEAVLSDARWKEAAPPTPSPLSAIEDIASLRANWQQRIQVALIERERAELLGCPSGSEAWYDSGSEIDLAICTAPWETKTLGRLRALGDTHIVPTSTDRADFARERFVPLIERTNRITIVDKYIGKNAIRGAELGLSELKWLLELTDGHGEEVVLSIFTVIDEGGDPPHGRGEVEAAVDEIWNGFTHRGGVILLQLFLGPARRQIGTERVVFPHDRHFRFGRCAFTASAGLDRLRRAKTRGSWNISYVWDAADVGRLIAEENTARRLTGAPRAWSV